MNYHEIPALFKAFMAASVATEGVTAYAVERPTVRLYPAQSAKAPKKKARLKAKQRAVVGFDYSEKASACPICSQTHVVLKASSKTSTVKRWVVKNEKRVSKALFKVLKEQGAKIIAQVTQLYAKLTKADLAFLLKTPPSDWEIAQRISAELELRGFAVSFKNEITDYLIEAYKAGGIDALNAVGMSNDVQSLIIVNQGAVAWSVERAAELVGMQIVNGQVITNPNPVYAITETVRMEIRKLVLDAVAQGMSTNDLRSSLQDSYSFSKRRADTIARTELAFAHVNGNIKTWQKSGRVGAKKWVLADTHPEPDVCDENDQKIVALDDVFPTGHFAPPAHPNCLCGVSPVLKDAWEKMKESGNQS